MTAAKFIPSHVKFRNRHPGMLAHKLRESMGTDNPVRVELRNGATRTGRVKMIVRDRSVNVAQLHDQASNLTVHFEDGAPIKLDEIRAVDDA